MKVEPFSDEQRRLQERRARLMSGCVRFLSGNGPEVPADALRDLADYARARGAAPDRYGAGDFLNAFEEEIAAHLGQEAAAFMPSGVMAQLIALRIWSDRAGSKDVAFHATSHVEANEEKAYEHLHGLRAHLLGRPDAPFTAADLAAAPAPVRVALLELPYRRLGGVLPSWEELAAIKDAARARGLRLHLDGARLWECGPFYGRPPSEIARGFDSAYVSFYKGLGALTGAMLCGPRDFVAEARVWRRRHGGTVFRVYPYVLSAKKCFDERRDAFGRYRERALALARALDGVGGARIVPAVPHAPMMHALLPRGVKELEERRDRIAGEDGLWLGGFLETARPDESLLEIAVGDATLALSDADARAGLAKLLA